MKYFWEGVIDMSDQEKTFHLYRKVVSALRKYCSDRGMIEFLPPKTIPSFAHYSDMHFTLKDRIILPYQLSIFNRMASQNLGNPTFCLGACYRNEAIGAHHLSAFYQFSFEIFSEDLNDLADFCVGAINSTLASIGRSAIHFRKVDLLLDPMIEQNAALVEVPTLVLNKRRGVPPLLNRIARGDSEMAIEILLPFAGETLDGGIRDPQILNDTYGCATRYPSGGASIGLERLMAFLTGRSPAECSLP